MQHVRTGFSLVKLNVFKKCALARILWEHSFLQSLSWTTQEYSSMEPEFLEKFSKLHQQAAPCPAIVNQHDCESIETLSPQNWHVILQSTFHPMERSENLKNRKLGLHQADLKYYINCFLPAYLWMIFNQCVYMWKNLVWNSFHYNLVVRLKAMLTLATSNTITYHSSWPKEPKRCI